MSLRRMGRGLRLDWPKVRLSIFLRLRSPPNAFASPCFDVETWASLAAHLRAHPVFALALLASFDMQMSLRRRPPHWFDRFGVIA
ncbi:hypothetical protein DFP72DRAFT_1179926 [Ephemerocybe angulata]|uniref:Uncharacterized protein n=1 Tax=Ephemerocybe angulata TaxID=980116 RepID=A0A8H6LTR0_9AGAR|nr:hypothetical protein DFP72DRAFT_1179926 [Tulosesus angulatus]